ncbi:hypothetical protein [Bremerella sp.]|uniref:hypothetical protein n=1 Tax=Bremerella sp. TaxID=2795602 RepID=UPI0039198384
METHSTWKSSATRRFAIEAVMAAFNHAQNFYSVPNPLRGLTKPAQASLAEDELALYDATDDLSGFCSRQSIRPRHSRTSSDDGNDVIESDRGMMWRVYASKTKKTR